MKIVDIVVAVLLIIGGLNWGLVGAFDFDIVAALFGVGSAISRIIYVIIGLSAIYHIFRWTCVQDRWGCCK